MFSQNKKLQQQKLKQHLLSSPSTAKISSTAMCLNFRLIAPSFTRLDIQRVFSIWYAKEDGLLKEIIHIEFPILKRLSLSFDSIESIQRISFLKAPVLESIDLLQEFNKITSLKPLRKIISKNIEKVEIIDNYLLEFDHMSQLNAGNFQTMKIEDQKNKNHQLCDISTLIKMEKTGKQKSLYIRVDSAMRIKQGLVLKSLQRKYM